MSATPEENVRLVHDTAMRTADAILAAFVVSADDFATSHRLVYERVKAGLEAYLALRQRELHRLARRPTPEDRT